MKRKPDSRPMEERLLEILLVGGPRKLSIMKAWASSIGLRLEEFDVRLRVMKSDGRVREFFRSGPHTDQSGDYLCIGPAIRPAGPHEPPRPPNHHPVA